MSSTRHKVYSGSNVPNCSDDSDEEDDTDGEGGGEAGDLASDGVDGDDEGSDQTVFDVAPLTPLQRQPLDCPCTACG